MAMTTRRFKPYPAYKDSGVEWLGKIPAHWEVKRLKHLAQIASGFAPPQSFDRLVGEYPVYGSNGVIGFCNQFFVSEQILAVGRVGASGLVNVIPAKAWVSDNALVLRDLRPTALLAWLRYFLESMNLGAQAAKNAQPIITGTFLGNQVLAVPPPSEQRAIAAFLDRETARIDALVAKKERLLELLREKRTALITRAVTKGLPAEAAAKAGLDPTVPMKDSGVEWLGEIPAHWEVKRLWHLTPSRRRIMYGIVLPGPNVDDGVPIVKGGDVSPGRLRIDCLNRTTREIEAGYVRSRLQGGDLVYAIRGSIGEVAMVPDELTGANLTQDAARVAYTSATHGPWLLYALKSRTVFAQLEAGALGATIRGINIRDLKRASLAVPSSVEQRAIAAFLDPETERFDALIAKVREAIDRLKEYRAALISAAVTGKIDVRAISAEATASQGGAA
jgi:type I restriction enzyme, S subunit